VRVLAHCESLLVVDGNETKAKVKGAGLFLTQVARKERRACASVRTGGLTMNDLEEALKHLAFDVHHFRAYARLHREGSLSACSPLIAQGVRYSLLLHFRLLLGFFNTKPWRDDRWVGHFRQFPGIEESFKSGPLTPNPKLQDVATQLHKRLAHLTATRWEQQQPPDMNFYASYFDEIERRITAFQAGLPAEMQKCFADALERWERAHPAVLNCSRGDAQNARTIHSRDSSANGSPTVMTLPSLFKSE
jgi:hypothetical protein